MDFSSPLLAVEDAQRELLRHFGPLPTEFVPLAAALGRTLATAVQADADMPPFANSAMDGYAVRAADLAQASRTNAVPLRIIERVAAGAMPTLTVESGTAIRIMTGAPLPAGADAVVPFEETSELHTPASAQTEHVQVYVAPVVGTNIRPAGEDMRTGDTVLEAGTVITPGIIGVLATVGAAQVAVYRRPRVAILATGDELVDVNQKPGPGQIRNSNGYANAAQVWAAGGEPIMLPIVRDNEAALLGAIDQGLAAVADMFITSGGVSVGDFDVVKQVLEREGKLAFWRVRMRPGKPLAFGHLRGVPLIGLPGNPASAMVCFELFARPAIHTLQGRRSVFRPSVAATLVSGTIQATDRRQFLRVVVRATANGLTADLTGSQGSGLVTSMARANGLLVVAEGTTTFEAGSVMPVLLLDAPE